MSISETIPYAGAVDVDTSNYRKHMSENPVQRRLIDRFHKKITKIVSDLHPSTILDAGCGEGFVADIFFKAMPTVSITGFDVLEDSVKLAALRNPRGTFTLGDIYNIDHPDDSFDVVVCFEVLEHLHEPDRALKELARVARHAVVMSVPHEPFFCLANAARGKNLDQTPRGSDPDHRNFWSREAFGLFVEQELDLTTLTGSMPWTIAVGRPR
ncbi:MAG TPA: class I SAM-dependent methyltransferase [Thermomicrobiales bacterium]|nr:class I SAM-dependent methyltransferase [Thermomicrobiales bacterium]